MRMRMRIVIIVDHSRDRRKFRAIVDHHHDIVDHHHDRRKFRAIVDHRRDRRKFRAIVDHRRDRGDGGLRRDN